MEFQIEKSKDELQRLASNFIERESNRNSLITVTSVYLTNDFKKVIIFVTVFPENGENAAIDFLKRQRSEFRDYVKKNSRLRRLPFFDFAIDKGEKSRQRIDDLL